MRRLEVFILILFSGFCGFSQSGLSLTEGVKLKMVGEPSIVVEDQLGNLTIDSSSTIELGSGTVELKGDWINDGRLVSGFGSVILSGEETQTIQNEKSQFYDLRIENSSNVLLSTSTSVSNQLDFQDGSLVTSNSDTLYLGNTGYLENEREGSYLIGHVQSNTLLNNNSVSPGNIGVELQSIENLGRTSVLRSSGLQIEGSSFVRHPVEESESIDRIWLIEPSFEPLNTIQYNFEWLPSNDNNLLLTQVQPWHKDIDWDTLGTEMKNGETRVISFSSKEKGYFTVGEIFISDFIPTGFTPDNDGKNDNWEIPFLEFYPEAVTQIYDRTGQLVYSANGSDYWDGTYKGKASPTGAYYYVIDLNNGTEAYNGNVNIIRITK